MKLNSAIGSQRSYTQMAEAALKLTWFKKKRERKGFYITALTWFLVVKWYSRFFLTEFILKVLQTLRFFPSQTPVVCTVRYSLSSRGNVLRQGSGPQSLPGINWKSWPCNLFQSVFNVSWQNPGVTFCCSVCLNWQFSLFHTFTFNPEKSHITAKLIRAFVGLIHMISAV